VELHENLHNEDGNGSPDDNPILANYPSVPQNLGKPFELPFIPDDPLGEDSSSSSSSSSDDEEPAADPAADPAVPPDAAWDEDAPNPLVIPNWLVLWALYLSNGTTACTESNYAIIRNLLSLAFRCSQLYWRAPEQTFLALQPIGRLSGRASFPSYSTIWLRTRRALLGALTVRLQEVPLQSTLLASGAFTTDYGEEEYVETNVGLILPSQYAIQDVSTPAVWSIFENDDPNNDMPLLNNRHFFFDANKRFTVDRSSPDEFEVPSASIGDIVDIDLANPLDIGYFPPGPIVDEEFMDQRIIRARVVAIFGVQHFDRFTTNLGIDGVSSSDVEAYLQFMDFDFPTHALPNKLLLKPSDIAVLLEMVHRPNEAVGIPPERFVLVHRFWTSEEDEDRHILMLANGKDPPEEMRMTPQNVGSFFNPFIESSHPVYTNVCKVVLIDSTASNTAKENIRNTPAIGYLAPTEDHPEPRPYFIYRFLLYSDGFSSGSSYTKRSDKGIYILPLNFKSHGRNSISSTRVLALAPLKVSPFSVFTALLDDIETGVTTGFDATDPNGIERKVFLDPVAVIGDTPALNYALDVLGHSGNSYCHLCKINKSVDVPDRSDSDTEDNAEGVNAEMGNIPLSDYMPIHNRTCSERFAFRHQSLMDSAAPANETRALGIKRTTAVSDYPLHRIANTLQTNRRLTPRARSSIHSSKAPIPFTLMYEKLC